MQLIPPQASHYLPLLALLPLALANAPPLHLLAFAILLLIRPSATQSYCNALISILLSALLLMGNCHSASQVILQYSSHSLGKMQSRVLLDWRVWVFTLEGAFLVLWSGYSYGKYREVRWQAMVAS